MEMSGNIEKTRLASKHKVSRFSNCENIKSFNHQSQVRYPTQASEQIRLTCNTLQTNKKTLSSRGKIKQLHLNQIIRDGQTKRRMFLKANLPQFNSILKPFDSNSHPSISKVEKQKIKFIIKDSTYELPKRTKRVDQKDQKHLRISFNKILKEIKQRNFISRDEQNEVYKIKLEALAATIKGDKSNINQDSLVYSEGIYIICDGHGTNGKQISEFVSTVAHRFFQQALKEHKIDTVTLKSLMKKTQIELQLSGIDTAFSGCTFIGLVINQNNIYSINVGDSKAIICQGSNIVELCTLHKPDNLIQKLRIEQCGGIIHPIQIGKDKFVGPNRVWAPGRLSWGPGLALSRAFGDKAARKYGVICQPQIKIVHMTFDDDFVVIGSDGLFDYMKDADISFFIRKRLKDGSLNREDLAHSLAEQAKKAATSQSDDISCIIILF